MGSTNFLQWNPGAVNQEDDAAYLADSQRAGGAVNDTPLPATLGNKGFYQWSTFCAAFGQMMAAKPGAYSCTDTSVTALAAVLANIVTESDLGSNIVSVSYSPTPNFNAASSNGFQMTLTGNITSSTISGVAPGQLLGFIFVQDSVGGRTIVWPSSFVAAPQPDPAANAISVILFRADLSSVPRGTGGFVSSNGVFFSAGVTIPELLSVGSLTLAAGAPNGYVLAGNGTIFAPTLAPGYTSGSNANGAWVKDPTGTITQRSPYVYLGTGSGDVSITFPTPFTTTTNLVVIPNSWDQGGEGFVAVDRSSITTTGFMVHQGGFDGQYLTYIAIGN